jgi:hypothetical protein
MIFKGYINLNILTVHLSLSLMHVSDTKVTVRVTLRLADYCQSVHLGIKPLDTHDQRFFSTEPLQS